MIAVVDEDLPRRLGESDKKIIGFAKRCRAVLISGDKDFLNIYKYPPKEYFGVVVLNFPNEVSVDFLIEETKKSLVKIPKKDFRGNLIIIEPGKIRVKKGR